MTTNPTPTDPMTAIPDPTTTGPATMDPDPMTMDNRSNNNKSFFLPDPGVPGIRSMGLGLCTSKTFLKLC